MANSRTMDHIDLKPYAFPSGMAIPRLMPYQEYPWNGDGYLAGEVLRLKEAHGLQEARETGCCLGSTTIWLALNFGKVTSTEINKAFSEIAIARLKMMPAGEWTIIQHENASEILEEFAKRAKASSHTFYFLDAHWNNHCPLLDELAAIAEAKDTPCILIHDFQVPGTDFGFDSMPDGRPFNLELVKPYLDLIYGEGKYRTNYPTKVEGAHRGWISIEPA
jgi:hypothetical protein